MRIYIIIAISVFLSNIIFGQDSWQTILQKNTIICLGEESHGVESYYKEKRKIIHEIDSLSDKPVFLLIESPLVGSVLSKLKNILPNYHYQHTNTDENISFFSVFENLGFDIQEDCRFKEFSKYLISMHYVTETDHNINVMDSILSFCIYGSGNYFKEQLTKEETIQLKNSIDDLKSEVIPKIHNIDEKFLIELCFKNRIFLSEYLSLPIKKRYKERIRYRDKHMSENILFLTRKYNKYTYIVWAANLHIGRKGIMGWGWGWTKDNVKSCAEYIGINNNFHSIAIAYKKNKSYNKYFDEIVLTKRKFVDDRYLKSNCKEQ